MLTNPLSRSNCRFLMIDVQEKLLPAMSNADQVLKNSELLLRAASVCSIHFDYSEQYPKGLGKTHAQLQELIRPDAFCLEKMHFSCVAEDQFIHLRGSGAYCHWVVWGIEAHVCLLGTVLDLRKQGDSVTIVADASGSRDTNNAALAFDAARDCGALVLPTETILYRILASAGTSEFKEMRPFLK